MKLITMAYLGEALGVIEKFGLKRISENHFENETLALVLTGEGPFEATAITTQHLSSKKYSDVLNLGFAGSFQEEFKLGQILEVRTFYLAIENKPSFKSFTLSGPKVDCLTSFKRLQDKEVALSLKGIASLVDREGWGVAFAAKMQNVPFRSFKLVSDYVGEKSCTSVMEKAPEWSQDLANHLSQILNAPEETEAEIKIPGYYFTFTSGHKLKNLLHKISLKKKTEPTVILESFIQKLSFSENTSPKDKGLTLISELELELDPLKKNLEDRLLHWKKPLLSQGFLVQTDPTWESRKIKISFDVDSAETLEDRIKGLKRIDLSEFHKIQDGHYVE